MALQHLTEETFDAAVSAAPLAMVDFWATWCGPCKMMGPIVEKLAGEYVIFTYTTGKGKTPKPVEAFLAANPGVKAVVGSGSAAKSHIETFNFAAENISKAYNIPIIAKLDGVGTDEDMAHIKAELEKL